MFQACKLVRFFFTSLFLPHLILCVGKESTLVKGTNRYFTQMGKYQTRAKNTSQVQTLAYFDEEKSFIALTLDNIRPRCYKTFDICNLLMFVIN